VITVRGFTATLVALASCLLLAAAAPATPPVPGEKGAFDAVRHALAQHWIDGADAAGYRAEIARAAHLIRTLPSGRREHVAVALEQVAAFDGRLTAPRALTLLGQLKANDDWFAKHWAPADKTDVTGADGLVYRYFAGRCLEFHPLAEFSALNARVAAGDVPGTEALADALAARGVHPAGGGVVWEYDFPFGGGRPPWTSGMAQAVAAQAFARAAKLVTQRTSAYLGQARAAYQAIRGRLLTEVAAGPWIRLYAFDRTPVLNAQLQTVLSLQSYATDAGDQSAAALAARMEHAAAAMLPRFDTGYWTYYSLAHDPSPLDYQQYVVQLLTKLGPADPRFAAAAARIAAYQRQPPAFMVANGGLGTVRFWLSKPATVTVVSAAGPSQRLGLGGGWHTVGWPEPKRVGLYPVQVTAVDWAGNRSSFQPLPIVRVAAAGGRSAATATAAAAPAPTPALSVGAGLDDPSQAPLARSLGLRLVRLGLAWPEGATAPDPAAVAALRALPPGEAVLLELDAEPLPVDDPGRAALGQYAAALAQQLPALRDLVLEPAPAPGSTDDYGAALEAVRSAVQGVTSTVSVGAAVDGAAAPRTVLAALGRSLAGQPVDILAFRPAPAAASGAWTATNVPQLVAAAQQALGSSPPVLVDGVAAASGSSQGAAYASVISGAACQPGVAAVVLDRLVDAADAPATGLFDPSGAAKPSVTAVRAAIASAQRGIVVCPGLQTVASGTLQFPTTLASGSQASLVLGCARDCLYLATLDGPDGRPVVATRGALRGGMPPVAVTLPRAKLRPGQYRLDVRLVDQVNPGVVAQQTSPPLTVGGG
jgi:hypothetical protein